LAQASLGITTSDRATIASPTGLWSGSSPISSSFVAASKVTYPTMAKEVSEISCTARRSARSFAAWSAPCWESRQAITTALDTSTIESRPKPTKAIEPACQPLTIAKTASRLFQPLVTLLVYGRVERSQERSAGESGG
jgi:hypothetical protein